MLWKVDWKNLHNRYKWVSTEDRKWVGMVPSHDNTEIPTNKHGHN